MEVKEFDLGKVIEEEKGKEEMAHLY